ncbi:hypothetical protein [Allorhodopirellula heiligendammensis]|uniref:Uncharacterized protein n=1 Tax=Allorhodopirellula heiligendammensis TaxID=2714739 RepID=A0A5C6C3N1_9BACT|nr:hypothetical protein Poly21_07910 [Allorhodopirellula heiligendammensis]
MIKETPATSLTIAGVSHSMLYATTRVTTPEPTVLPASRMAKWSPWLIAIGCFSAMLKRTPSPGIH